MKKKLLFIILSFIFIGSITISAVWYQIPNNVSQTAEQNLNLGYWHTGIVYDYDQNANYKKDDLVIKNGVLYVALRNINSNDNYHDPKVPNTNLLVPMRWSESTKEYRSFHRYVVNDYVYYEGTYYIRKTLPHDPNTFTQQPPTQTIYWEEVTNVNPLQWFPYVVYYEGQKVFYNNQTYECIRGGFKNVKPSSSSSYWTQV